MCAQNSLTEPAAHRQRQEATSAGLSRSNMELHDMKYAVSGDAGLYNYLLAHSYRPNEHLEGLHKDTLEGQPMARMCSPTVSIPLLQMLVKLTQAKSVVEVGVFTGYTTLGMALALPCDGIIHACDISSEFAAVGEPYWRAAGVREKINLLIGPATEVLGDMLADGGEGSIDMGFIDADKPGYDSYYELLLRLVRPGGLIVVDNVLWHGRVLEENPSTEDTKAIKAINDKIFKDDRVDICMLQVSDGVTLARKK
ncbi:hypothetical protein CVIRNUC_008891 [Coccomyxa viridis]|uniref:Caffeoyl-CoA O-methyltransferase n=1 Tax=Coccomyxa viridis TaxID=1274662 RepID=A0AAV1IGU4_9CHLO|nr:hypothetical protein CVIRNUC_008891 [Coccomyxa viridis]